MLQHILVIAEVRASIRDFDSDELVFPCALSCDEDPMKAALNLREFWASFLEGHAATSAVTMFLPSAMSASATFFDEKLLCSSAANAMMPFHMWADLGIDGCKKFLNDSVAPMNVLRDFASLVDAEVINAAIDNNHETLRDILASLEISHIAASLRRLVRASSFEGPLIFMNGWVKVNCKVDIETLIAAVDQALFVETSLMLAVIFADFASRIAASTETSTLHRTNEYALMDAIFDCLLQRSSNDGHLIAKATQNKPDISNLTMKLDDHIAIMKHLSEGFIPSIAKLVKAIVGF